MFEDPNKGALYTGEGAVERPAEVRLNLKREDIHPEIPEEGGTILVLQVNAKDDRRDPNSPEFGVLMPEAAEEVTGQAKKFFDDVFEGLSDEERARVAVIVVASDAKLVMPPGSGASSPHRRAFETGEKVIEGIRTSMTEHGVGLEQLLNTSEENGDEPVAVPGLVDLTMWESPEFVKYLEEKAPELVKLSGGKLDLVRALWVMYEEDLESEKRLELGVEGPSEIAIRMRKALTDLTIDLADQYHREHPDALLYIWSVSHYDSISPWVKGYVYQANPAKLFVPTEKAGGITIKIDKTGETAETTIAGQTYQIPSLLHKSADDKYDKRK